MTTKSATKTTSMTDTSAALVAAYKSATDAKGRADVRNTVKANFEAAMTSGDFDAAQHWFGVQKELRVDSAPKSEALDPAQVISDRIAALNLAATLLADGTIVPEGLDVGSGIDYTSMPDPGDVIDAATKLAASKITRSTERNSIADAIMRAFADTEPGTVLRVSEVARRGAVEGYRPSPGAIRAHLDGKNPVEGYSLLERDTKTGTPVSVRFDG